MVMPSIIAQIAYVLMITLGRAAVFTEKRMIKPSASILNYKIEEKLSIVPAADEFQSSFHKDGVYKFLTDKDYKPPTEIDIIPAIIDESNEYPIKITVTSESTPEGAQSTQPSTSFSSEQATIPNLSDSKTVPVSEAIQMRDNSHASNDQNFTVDAEESVVRRPRDISCNNRYTGDCQDLETASICPWRYIWNSNGPQNVECLTCKPTVGCDNNCLLTCQPWYLDGRAVACLAALPCTHAS